MGKFYVLLRPKSRKKGYAEEFGYRGVSGKGKDY